MILLDRRRQANAAFAETRTRERVWRALTHDTRAWCTRHRAGVIVGGGFFAGLATSLMPIAPLLRLASAFAGTVSLMLEGPFLRMLSAAHRDASRGAASAGAAAVTPNDPSIETLAPAAAPLSAPVIVPPASIEPESPDEEAPWTPQLRNRLQIAIVVILTLYTCAIGEAVIVPVLIAVLFGLMLAPPVRLLERSRVPRAIGSLLMVLLAIAIVGGAITALASPARAWAVRMPSALVRIETVRSDLRRTSRSATEASREIGKITHVRRIEPGARVDTSPSRSRGLSAAPAVIAGIIITILLTFLFLLHGDDLLRKFVTLAPHLRANAISSRRRARRRASSRCTSSR